jgi:hypothetical protein
MIHSQEIVQFVQIKNINRFVHQAVNLHFNHQSKFHRLRATIHKNVAKHTKNDHRNVHQWQHLDFILSSRSRREIQQYQKYYVQTHDIVFIEFNLAMRINYAINKFLNIYVNRFVFVELIVIMTIIVNIFSFVVIEIKNVVII